MADSYNIFIAVCEWLAKASITKSKLVTSKIKSFKHVVFQWGSFILVYI